MQFLTLSLDSCLERTVNFYVNIHLNIKVMVIEVCCIFKITLSLIINHLYNVYYSIVKYFQIQIDFKRVDFKISNGIRIALFLCFLLNRSCLSTEAKTEAILMKTINWCLSKYNFKCCYISINFEYITLYLYLYMDFRYKSDANMTKMIGYDLFTELLDATFYVCSTRVIFA